MSKRLKGHLNLRSSATKDSRRQWLRDGTDHHDFWLEEEEPQRGRGCHSLGEQRPPLGHFSTPSIDESTWGRANTQNYLLNVE